jgi:hypothetical protein
MTLPRRHESETIGHTDMPASRFDEVLPVLLNNQHKQVGVCAMGPIGAGDTIEWMRVWAWQQDGQTVVASAGCAGEHVHGAHPLNQHQNPPFAAPTPKWMVQTGFQPNSPDFKLDKPVQVQAMALVKNGADTNFVQWNQAVLLREPHHH